ncbi:MAG: ATP-dependent zinc metalloprotease FtsH [Bacilli bacterium]|nr:ATP-dependent zinc metalloprotease FtsH [Bacilli bacterium]MDD3305169.1 ATP-dependent zinc metalloprotease FtsH [Bacilli bacterium]MDD4053994.1 ATP-dependent zinc metalloprotease FtsH [Bacilli bacterium]MDD4411725.1 ATP-dependent zinc metalloprotease FtsH [Bacilli bacterium]
MKINKNIKKNITPYITFIILAMLMLIALDFAGQKVNQMTYDQFEEVLATKKVEEINITPRDRAKVYEIRGKLEGYSDRETFFVRVPFSEQVMSRILMAREESNFKLETNADPESSTFLLFLLNILPIIVLIGLAFFFFSRQMNGANKSLDFGKSRAKLNEDSNEVTFKDVAGLQEEKEEVQELIDFLKNPKKFQSLGARIPKGVLLVGPPGTGKTLLAKAVAGEASVPFYFISGSDFVELFVGIGASRVRDMFKQAKHNAPCLIFIDEIDAVGRQRGTGLGGGHDEREQTLNQLLTEMDGFGANEGIIIIAATNRPDVLDPALLRPGRFDRQVTVNLPDVKGREEILEVHARNKVLAPSVTLENLAKRTVGFSGADLENLLNESALLAVRRNKKVITMSEVDEATDRVLMGPAKKSKKYTEKEKNLVAHHEAGHVVLGLKLNDANDVQKVTIIPRSYAGGYAMMVPKEERYTQTKKELLERITGLLGGRVAEELVFGEITTGAHNDFEKATKIARSMVTEYGMSDLGPVQLEHQEEAAFLGRDYNKSRNFSNEVAHEIDVEMRKIINECYEKAKEIINENKELLNLIATTLIEYETLTKEQIDYLVENGTMPEEEKEVSENTIVELRILAKEKGIKGYTKMNKKELESALDKEIQKK